MAKLRFDTRLHREVPLSMKSTHIYYPYNTVLKNAGEAFMTETRLSITIELRVGTLPWYVTSQLGHLSLKSVKPLELPN